MPFPLPAFRVLAPAVLLALGGCAAVAPGGAPAMPGPDAAEGPLAAFARDASPGQRGVVALADGRAVPVTLLRAYAAGSGRECRLLRVEDVPGGRSELVCRDPDRGWVPARPLLRGGAVGVR
jgi:hypothetical protein